MSEAENPMRRNPSTTSVSVVPDAVNVAPISSLNIGTIEALSTSRGIATHAAPDRSSTLDSSNAQARLSATLRLVRRSITYWWTCVAGARPSTSKAIVSSTTTSLGPTLCGQTHRRDGRPSRSRSPVRRAAPQSPDQ